MLITYQLSRMLSLSAAIVSRAYNGGMGQERPGKPRKGAGNSGVLGDLAWHGVKGTRRGRLMRGVLFWAV